MIFFSGIYLFISIVGCLLFLSYRIKINNLYRGTNMYIQYFHKLINYK